MVKVLGAIGIPVILFILRMVLGAALPALKAKAKSSDTKYDDLAVELAEIIYYCYLKKKPNKEVD